MPPSVRHDPNNHSTRSPIIHRMHYSNTDTRLKQRSSLSPAILQRLQRIRKASLKARTAAEKKALAALLTAS